MKWNKIKLIILGALCLFLFSVIPLLILHFYAFSESANSFNWLELTNTIFYGFGVNALLTIFVGIAFTFLFERIKKIGIRAKRAFTWTWILFIFTFVWISLQWNPGNWMTVAKEGWLSLYKHPLVWILFVLLVGNIVLYLFRGKDSTKLS